MPPHPVGDASHVDQGKRLRYSRRIKSEVKANLAHLESLLRARKLDGAIASDLPIPVDRLAHTGLDRLDEHLSGGLPRGHLSEIIGPRSSGRASVLCALLAAATRRGEVVALIDAFDSFDPVSGQTAGIDLARVLWVRGQQVMSRHASQVMERALKAAALVCQAGQFGMVVIDMAEASPAALRRFPLTTWLRLARAIEGSETVGVLVGPIAMGRSSSGRSIVLTPSCALGFSWTLDCERVLAGGVS